MSATGMEPRPVGRVGMPEVQRVEEETRTFRALDYRYGGGWCHEAALAQLSWGYRLLEAASTERVKAKLCAALGDLTSLVGWTAFDAGFPDAAHARFDRAIELAREGGDNGLAANILYRKGRVYLHYDAPREALTAFTQGERAAAAAGSQVMLSLLCANQAWAQAKLGRRDEAIRLIGRADEAYYRAGDEEVPVWARFFDQNDLAAMIGTVYTELALGVDPAYALPGCEELSGVVERYGTDMTRSRSFCLVMLALDHLLMGDFDEAAAVGARALAAAEGMNSARFADRLRPLEAEAVRRAEHPEARGLAERIATFAA
ncbi:transcriptional regulator [Amycolatopsis magusensis]|uniref:Tetratricopeptide (TPR) repeat protein n=1 Tax=Amycolatopsis magusensis TaxID=882444 RepID=A0ABS4PSS3_9PSEU|nr:transcriptional regulator [Amycolatopsis magusensis]MBP2182479.1 tetratricopeptide (TPR) repeat protein [Amycolatopsis magusensis]MDI5979555.1 transcriptional regulator [Amycolatopsis magusensis]